MTVPKVLVLFPLVWLRRIVLHAVRRACGNEGGALIEIQSNVALEMNRNRKVIAGREAHRSTTSRGCHVNCFVDGRSVERLTIAGGAERFHVVNTCVIKQRKGNWPALRNEDCRVSNWQQEARNHK